MYQILPNAGNLNKKVSIIKTIISQDEEGNRLCQDSLVCQVWAGVQDATMREYYEAARNQMDHVVNFSVRYRPDIKEGMFVLLSGEKYEIKQVNAFLHKRDYLTLKTTRWAVSA